MHALRSARRFRLLVLPGSLAVLALLAACAPQAPTPGATLIPSPTPAPAITPGPSPSLEPSAPPSSFAFDPESVVLYYQSIGYSCSDPIPSTAAVDHLYRSCQLLDPNGRTRVVGIVTDPADNIADAFTSLTGTAGEKILDPSAALEPFSAFLGAMLGETRGESLLTWLAGNLGEAYVTTTLDDLTIATYTESPNDHSRLYLEIGSQAYLESPTPSNSASPSNTGGGS